MLVQIAPRPAATISPPPLVAPSPDAVRVRPARPVDMAEVAPLIDGFARRGLMLPKPLDQLHRTFREFLLARDAHGLLLGCVALRVLTPELAEVSALAVVPHVHGRGVGRRLVDAVLREAAALEIRTLFALTLAPGFFHRFGFETTSRERFPQKIATDCAVCPRRSGCREVTVALQVPRTIREEGAGQ